MKTSLLPFTDITLQNRYFNTLVLFLWLELQKRMSENVVQWSICNIMKGKYKLIYSSSVSIHKLPDFIC